MRRLILKNKLLNYLQTNPGWHKKVHLFVVAEQMGYSPETCGRRLRELADEGKIKAGYYSGQYAKNLTKYTADEIPVETIKKTVYESQKVGDQWIAVAVEKEIQI